jgi:hypothetical protein
MTEPTASFALVTLSYRRDLERCRLLVESAERLVTPESPHYLVVPRCDLALFRELATRPHVRLLEEERLLPWWIFRTPVSPKWRANLLGLPVRGWIAQQLGKLALPDHVAEEVLVLIDSDVVFFRPLDLRSFVRGDRVRLFAVPGRGDAPDHRRWYRGAARLLGLPRRDYFGCGYVGNVITWRRDTALALRRHVERTWHLPWIVLLSNQVTMSEYVLYGVFCETVLGEKSGHYADPVNPTLEYWTPGRPDAARLRELVAGVRPHHVALMVTAKAGLSAAECADLVRALRDDRPPPHGGGDRTR